MEAQSRFRAQLFDDNSPPSCLDIEMFEMNEPIPSNIVYKWDEKSIKRTSRNPFIVHSVQTWFKIHKMLGQNGFLSLKSPLWGNRLIPILHQNKHFECWPQKGIVRLEHLFAKGTFMSFDQLRQKYLLPYKGFFKYLQAVVCSQGQQG